MSNYTQELEAFQQNYAQLKKAHGTVSREIYLSLCHTHFVAVLTANEQALCRGQAGLTDEVIETHKRHGTIAPALQTRWRAYHQLAKTSYDNVVEDVEHFIATLAQFSADMEALHTLNTPKTLLGRQI